MEQGLQNGPVSVRPSVSLSHQSNAAAACDGFAAERRMRKRYRSIAPGARQQQRHRTALSSKCGQCHVDTKLTRLNTALGYFYFRPIKILAVFTVSVEFVSGRQHAIIYRHIGRTGLGWIDGQKSPVFCRRKSGNLTSISSDVYVHRCENCWDEFTLEVPVGITV